MSLRKTGAKLLHQTAKQKRKRKKDHFLLMDPVVKPRVFFKSNSTFK